MGPCVHCGSSEFPNHPYEKGRCVGCTPTFSVLDWDYKNDYPKFLGEGPLYFGVEVEVQIEKGNNKEMAHKFWATTGGNETPFYLQHDGTVDPGFEIVYQPMSFDYIRQFDYSTLFELDKYRSFNNPMQAIHIHMSRKAFTPLQLYKFQLFIFQNIGFITFIGERQPNSYCSTSLSNALPKVILLEKGTYKDDTLRRKLVNNQNVHTIELRFFATNLAPASFYKNIEFCHALWRYTKNRSIRGSDLTPRSFIDFVSKNKREYPNLHKFCHFWGSGREEAFASLSPILNPTMLQGSIDYSNYATPYEEPLDHEEEEEW
jgi:hypothetical protein